MLGRPAADGEEIAFSSNGGEWIGGWHSAVDEDGASAPPGQRHGASAWCVTSDGGLVLVSPDGREWGWPGGRPEGDESWEDTLRREVREEACARVVRARLLGFGRAECLSGPEKGLVLVRSLWRAHVELLPWDPQFEVRHRRVVPVTELASHLSMEPGLEPIYARAAREAGLA